MKKGFHVFLFVLFAVLMSQSAWAEYYDLSSNGEAVTIPCTDPKSVSVSKYNPVTSFVIYDDGGSGNNYSNNCGGYLTINGLEGYGFKVSGWIMAETYDTLRILNGSSISWFPQLIADIRGTGVNSKNEFGPLYTTDNHMVVSLRTDGSVVGPGVMMNVELVPLRKATGTGGWIWFDNPYDWFGWVSENESQTYSEGMTVPFALNPNYDEKELWGLKVRRADGGGLVDLKKNANTGLFEFVMPPSDVYVQTKRESSQSGYDLINDDRSLYLHGTKVIKLYDDGGTDYPYTNNFDGWLKLSTPEGFYFQVTGTVETEPSSYGGYDYLEIYDGEVSKGTSATPKCKVYTQGNKAGKVNVPSNCVSTAEYMTIHFRTDGSITAPGLDLTVSSLYRTYSVNVKQTSNGSISSDAYSSQKGSKVTLTVKPNSGYILKGVEVVNKTTGFSYTYGSYYSNTVTFTMPASDVNVTPTFVKDTYSITKKTVTGGSVSGASSAKVGSTVAMTTKAASGYLYKGANVVVEDRQVTAFGEKGFLDGKFSFTMPIGDVTVTPLFTNDWSAEGGLFINMTKAKNVIAEIPSGVKSFKVYDNGGKSGYYSENSRDTLVLKVPSGYVLQLSGSTNNMSSSYDSLLVYNGSGAYASSLLGKYKGSSQAISNVLSSGEYMTLVFHSGSSTNAGFDLTVKVYPAVNQIIYTNKNPGGSVTSTAPTTGKNGSTISYTYSYNSGYMVSDITAVDADGKSVMVSGGWYNDKKASFKMPLGAVTITSSYTNDWSAEGGLYINMRKSSKFTATIPSGVKSFKVYDEGGKDGNYSGNNRDTLILKAPAGYVLQLSGSVTTENNSFDSLRVYSGMVIHADSLLGTYKSSTSGSAVSISGKVLSRGEKMTLLFNSDGGGNYKGLDLTVKVIPTVNQITYTNKNSGGSVTSAAPTTGNYGSTVNYTYSYSSGYMVKDITAVSADGDSLMVIGGWYNDKQASFKMPLAAVTVTSSYTDDWSAEGGLYINMLKARKFTATIPEGVNSFKVYDEGGKDGNYSGNNRDTLILKAPAGYVLQLSGSVTTENNSFDSLRVYSGMVIHADSLLGTYKSSTSGSAVSISGKVLSRGENMTLLFNSDGSGNYKGLDLTVKVIPIANQITYTNKNSGGSVTSGSPTTGKDGSTVNYTYSYDSGYMVSDITAVDADGVSVTVTGGWYNSKKAFFKMPLAAVTITSSYTDDWSADGGLYINMLKASKFTATIPKGVNSFKVYDEGGKSGTYSGHNSDTLVLKAPAGYVLQLSGSVTTENNSFDSLRVYSGTKIHADSLLGTYKSSTSGSAVSISGKVLSRGENMTLLFNSDGSGNYNGLDLTVTLILVDYAIQVNSATNGKVSASKTTELHFGDTVSLNAVPNSGYMLKDVVAKDLSGNTVKVSQYSFSVSELVMPAKDLVITPTFTNTFTAAGGLHLDMRRNKKVDVSVPSNIKSFKIYDNGGKDGVYEANSNDTLTLAVPEGYRMKLTGNVKTERGYDYFYVFDGANTSAKRLLAITGPATYNSHDQDTSFAAIYSTGEYMTLRFRSDVSNQYEGLDLTVTLERINYTITRNSVTGGTLNSHDTDTLGAEVYLTGSPTDSYHLSDVTVVDKDGNDIKSPIYSFDRSKFTMPASNVTVTPTWTDNLTAEGGLHIDLLKNGKIDANIPAGVKSFNLYDNGGKNRVYASNSNDTLTLNAPTGFYLVVTGSITLEAKYDSLYIFDGKNTTAKKLFGRSGATSGINFTSSGESLTFRFKSDATGLYNGLDLKVSVEPITYGIAIADAANGRVSSDKPKAAKDSIVNLSWVYTTGYLIRDIDVRDTSDNKVVVNGGWYSGAKASFTMPESPVIVTPTFTNNLTAEGDNGLYINMPTTGSINAEIPANVKSFKVYDNGGKDGAYSNNCNGTLVLTAPEGYVLELGGNVITENPYSETKIYDYLSVYDGADKSANIVRNQITGTVNVETVRSSGRNLTLLFYSDISNAKSGLDLTVTLVPVDYTITVATVTGGSMTSDKESAIMDGVVTLTAVPKNGYLIDGVEVKDANNNVVALNNDIYWYCGTNKVSFKMPSASVSVTPKFSPINALSVNMPKKLGEMKCDVNIPENVTSFKIYDDGGEAGNYSNNVNGELWVAFDEKSGYAGLKLSGTVSAPKDGAHLYVTAVTDDAMELFYSNNGSSDGHAEDIGTFINSSSLIIEFRTGNVGSGAGLDLRVDVVKSPGAGVKVVYDDAHVIGDGKLSRWASITDGDKTSELNIPEDVAVDTITLSRNFKTNNVYNTILFPFDVKADSLDGVVKVLRFNGFKQKEDESWVVRMKRVWTKDSIGRDIDVNANTPYLVVMDDPKMVVRGGVTLRKTVEPIAMAEDCNWKFVGTLSYQEWPEGNPLVYGFSNNQFVKAGENVRVGALRAYLLKPKPKLASERPSLNGSAHAYEYIAPVYIPDEFDIVEDDDETGENTTVIGRYNTRTGEFRMLPSYDIKGRKLNGKPNVHKAYYGKKVIRK